MDGSKTSINSNVEDYFLFRVLTVEIEVEIMSRRLSKKRLTLDL